MEDLVPVYMTILQYKAGGQPTTEGSWYSELPAVQSITIQADSASSDRTEIQLRLSECLLTSDSAMVPQSSSELPTHCLFWDPIPHSCFYFPTLIS
ncbi:hypothetical protein TB2_028943 [Malus domestica]